VKYTLAGIMPLVMISTLGGVLAVRGIWDKRVVDSIAKAYTNFFNPFFVFFNVTEAIKLSEIGEIWPLLVSPTVILMTGILVSWVHSLFFRNLEKISGVVKCVLIFNNIANLPVILMKGICSPYGPLKGDQYCENSNSYISLQVFTYNALIWSYGWSLVSRDKSKACELLSEDERGMVKVPVWKNVLKNLTLPGPLSCLAALVVSLIPGVQNLLYDPSSAFYCITQSCLQVGIAGVVLGQTSLGANLVSFKSQKLYFSKPYLLGIILFKNLIMPLFGLGLTYLAWHCGVFGHNHVMAYIIYISFCTPTAFIVLIICQSLQYGTKEVTWLMLSVYAFSIPTLIVFTYIFFVMF